MNVHKWLTVSAILVLVMLALTMGLTQAQGPEPPEEYVGAEEVGAAAVVPGRIPIQGRLSDAGGNPLDGSYSVTFRLYEVSTGGTALCTSNRTVNVDDGLFSTYMSATDCDIDGRQLYLGISVGSDAEMTPRQAIYSVPYAWSLRPGAVISTTGYPALHVESTNTSGRGLRAYASATSGANYGVVGASKSPDGFGGYFYNTSESPNPGFGVAGLHPGYDAGDLGSWAHPAGYFGGMIGVIGLSKDSGGTGVLGLIDDATGWAGMFTGIGNGVRISVPAGKVGLEVIGGTKNAVVGTEDGARLLYTEESTEVWFTDYGFGQLEDGLTIISIDPIFAQTVNLEQPYHVFVQVYGDADVYVSERTAASFEVHLRDGDPGVAFSYRIVAKRVGYEDDRLERAPQDDDLVLNP